jgi:hypothetical protein
MAKLTIRKKASPERDRPVAPLNLGDRVKIKHYGGGFGRIVELRGPLGPGGAPVYRVKVHRRPNSSYIEVLGSQIEPAPRMVFKAVAKATPAAKVTPAAKAIPAAKATPSTKAGHAVKRKGAASKARKPV